MSANTSEARINPPKKVFTQPYDFSVQDLVNKIKEEDILLDPEYQRYYVWEASDGKENKKSRLIESLLLNIPVPVIYFAETETLKYEVIDGQQRLRTFKDFLNDKFALKNLEVRNDVNGKKYSELEQPDKDEIRKRSIRAIVILNNSDEDVKYQVFERLNMGSIELTPQELRNNTLRGEFNQLLRELAKNEIFHKLFKFHLNADEVNMSREELVLRFFAYQEPEEIKRTDDLQEFLTEYMKEEVQKEKKRGLEITATKNRARRDLFNSTIETINKYLGDAAFSTFRQNKTWNDKSSRLIYEIEMLAFAGLTENDIKIEPAAAREVIKKIVSLEDENTIGRFGAQIKSGGKEFRDAKDTIRNALTGTAHVG
jgi:hypothetical protein